MKLKYIRPLFFCCALILGGMVSCSEPIEKPKSTASKKKKVIEKKEKKTVKKKVDKKKATYPKLTMKNYADFLRSYGEKASSNIVKISSSFGTIKIRLYDNTPLHRDNFLYLTERNYFDMTQFYRVSKNFVCQAGNSDEEDTQDFRLKIGSYNLKREMNNDNCHKYGAVAMARIYQNNPEKVSSPFEWYIVLGEKYNKATLKALGKENNIKYTEEQINYYTTIGGAPFLDKQHTVFGEVIEGMDVVKAINKVNTDSREWPLTNIPIKAKIVKK